ncbi:hypothetical protein FBY24_3097 [Cellulomonas sp. SLBN-39]|nr:hypothetical protein FBY24_3097 [Cellulomonas sp. SLBN-39]
MLNRAQTLLDSVEAAHTPPPSSSSASSRADSDANRSLAEGSDMQNIRYDHSASPTG